MLDELGAGTDHQEVDALAKAILDTLMLNMVTTLVATHYPELKAHAHARPGVSNANVEFDLESLRPTYRLTIGLPGRSNALAIADRLGLDPNVIDFARSMLAPEELRTESLLDEIHRQREAAGAALLAADEKLAASEAVHDQRQQELATVELESLEILDKAQQKAEQEIADLKEEARKLRRRVSNAAQTIAEVKAVEELTRTLEKKAVKPTPRKTSSQVAQQKSLKVGDLVHLRTLQADGEITELGDGKAEVRICRLRVRAGIDELVQISKREAKAKPRRSARRTASFTDS